MKKMIPVAILLVTCFCMSGCGMIPGNLQTNLPAASVEETVATEAAESTSEQAETLANVDRTAKSGFFVIGPDGNMQELTDKNPEMNSSIPDSMVYTGYFFWGKDEVIQAIPNVKPGETDLIYMQNSSLPQQNTSIVLERLEDKGYTFGITFAQMSNIFNGLVETQPTDPNAATAGETTAPLKLDEMIVFSYPIIFPGTSAAEVFSGDLDLDAYLFTSFNGNPVVPNMIPPYYETYFNLDAGNTLAQNGEDTLDMNLEGMVGVFEKLTQNEEYTLGGYKGTVPIEIKLKADVHCFTTVYPYTYLDSSIAYQPSTDMTKNYSVVNIPADLPEGYYILNGKQVFYLDSDIAAPAPTEATTPVE